MSSKVVFCLFFLFFSPVVIFHCQCDAAEVLQVLAPSSLKGMFNDGKISDRPALFGDPSYATTLIGQLIYATPADGCTTITTNTSSVSPGMGMILIIDRSIVGGANACTFKTKVRNAQRAGAVAAIIVDSLMESFAQLPFMADDNSINDVLIPSMLITKTDGDLLKDFMASAPTLSVYISMTYQLPRPDNRVEWDLFTSSWDPTTQLLKSSIVPVIKQLDASQFFTPHHYIIDGVRMGCHTQQQYCGDQCTNRGRYCARDPDGFYQGLAGRDIVMQDLREYCVWKYLNVTYGEGRNQWKYFQYVTNFFTNCYDANNPSKWQQDTCSDAQISALNMSTVWINNCRIQSGGVIDDVVNPILQNMINDVDKWGINLFPSVYVNLVPYRGTLNCYAPIKNDNACGIVTMICNGFKDKPASCLSDSQCPFGSNVDCLGQCGTSVVDRCGKCLPPDSISFDKTCNGCFLPLTFDVCGVCGGNGTSCATTNSTGGGGSTDNSVITDDSSSGTSASVIIAIVVSLVVGFGLFGAIVFYYMQRQNRRLRTDLESVMKQYLPLADGTTLGHATDGPGTREGHTRLVEDDEPAESTNI